jgi:hypothetical protein
MPSRRWNEVGFRSCAPGGAVQFILSGVRIGSSPTGSSIITIGLHRITSQAGKRNDTACAVLTNRGKSGDDLRKNCRAILYGVAGSPELRRDARKHAFLRRPTHQPD